MEDMENKKYISKIVKSGQNILIKDLEAREALQYTDVYIGAGETSSDVMVAANHHDTVLKGSAFSVTANSNYLWVILPSAYSPILAIGGIAVPMYLSGTTTVDDVTYNIYKSNNTYRSTFSVNLL